MKQLSKAILTSLIVIFLFITNFQNIYPQLVNDFRVNDDTTNYQQFRAKVGTDEKGNFVVVWYDQDIGNSPKIRAQIFDSNAHPLGVSFQINNDIYSTVPSLSVRKNGSFAVSWSIFGTKFRIFNNKGLPIIDELSIRDSAGTYTALDSDIDGNFIVVWEQYNSSLNTDIYFQRIDSSGKKIGNIQKVNDDTIDVNHELPDITVRNDGSFIIVWNDYRAPSLPSVDDIYMQMFDKLGNKIGGNQKVNDDFGINNFQVNP